MTEDLQKKVDELTQENNQLKAQATQNSRGVQGLLAQMDAYKDQLSESMGTALNLRTSLIMFQKQNKEYETHVGQLNKRIEELTKKLEEANKDAAPTNE